MGCGRLVAGRERVAGRAVPAAARPRRRLPAAAAGPCWWGTEDASGPTPARLRSTPNRVSAGARHAALAGAPAAFRPTASTATAPTSISAAGFDSTPSDPYPFLYAAFTDTTALAEVFLRGLPFDDRGARILPRKLLAGRRLSRVELIGEVTPLTLLSTLDLAAVGQDEWLVQAEAAAYGQTRHWAHWLRCQALRAVDHLAVRATCPSAVVLFGDRCPPGLLQAVPDPPPEDLDSVDALLLRRLLALYGVTVRLPPTVLATSRREEHPRLDLRSTDIAAALRCDAIQMPRRRQWEADVRPRPTWQNRD